MNNELPQPFDQEDIRKDPKAVVIALLIGLLLIFGSVIGVLYYRKEDKEEDYQSKIDGLYSTILKERNDRIFFYEKMIFFQRENEKLKSKDSLIKQRTEPLVQKILQ